ncbi:hypothetical protein D1872_72960 [compost metagenome]
MINCRRCSRDAEPHSTNPHLCEECVKAENNRVSHVRRHNENWLDVAAEAELELYERQPGETDREYQIWLAYRDAYPSVRPSNRLVAEQLGTTVNVVSKVSQRWGFPVRMQAWAKHCDELIMRKRQEEIVGMNESHVSMAATLNAKLKTAIDGIQPSSLSPKEIQGLMKVATDLERKARLDTTSVTPVVSDDKNPNLQDTKVPTDNLQEIVAILGAAGVLNNFGIRQTTTTEVVVKGDDD